MLSFARHFNFTPSFLKHAHGMHLQLKAFDCNKRNTTSRARYKREMGISRRKFQL
jgi:hypothetical protein